MSDNMTMTNDEAHDWLLGLLNTAPSPRDAGRFGAAIRAIRAKAITDAKEMYTAPPSDPAAPLREAAQAVVDTFPGVEDPEADYAVPHLAALDALRAALAFPAPEEADRLGPDDHGHTGRLWCDPCVGHGVMLDQAMSRAALATPAPKEAARDE